MNVRSTRNKIRYQGQMCVDTLDKLLEHLRYLDELSEGGSDYINEKLPVLVQATEAFKQALIAFREGL